MRKFRREAAPEFLAGRWEAWGREWEERQRKGGSFHWHQVDGEMVNQRLLPGLRAQTQDHCSFCGAFPVSPPSDPTIEHFRPKSRFPARPTIGRTSISAAGFASSRSASDTRRTRCGRTRMITSSSVTSAATSPRA